MQQYMSHDIGVRNELVIIYDPGNGEKNCALLCAWAKSWQSTQHHDHDNFLMPTA